MSARGRDRSDRTGAVGLAAAVTLALVAAGMLMTSTDVRWLRVAVVLTLWAFLLAAMVRTCGENRRATLAGELELRRVYEVELAREVAARREYELRLEVQLRRELEGALREEVSALRRDLVALHQRIVSSLGTDSARAALRTESTRLSEVGPYALTGDGSWLVTDEHDLPMDVTELPAEVESPGRVVHWLPETADASDAAALPNLAGRVVTDWGGPAVAAQTGSSAGLGEPGPGPVDPPAGPVGATRITSGSHTGDGWLADGWGAAHNMTSRDMHTEQERPGHERHRPGGNSPEAPRSPEPFVPHRLPWCDPAPPAGYAVNGGTGDTVGLPGVSFGGKTTDSMYRSPASCGVDSAYGGETAVPGGDSEVSGETVEFGDPKREETTVSSGPPGPGQPAAAHSARDDTETSHGRHHRGDDDTGTFVRLLGGRAELIGKPRRRHYREDDEENEVLARILGR